MLINTLTTETGNHVLLIDQVFSEDRLKQFHAICAKFTPGCEHWRQPSWCIVPQHRPRYLFDGKGDEWAELVQFFNSAEVKQPIEQHLDLTLEYTTSSMWADLTGFGTLEPHKEAGGSYMMQIYLTNKSHDYSGTTIYNEAGEVLVQMPYRDNFAWFFHGMKVMHGRHHDVPKGITRFTLQIWYRV